MKKIKLLFLFLFLTGLAMAQSADKMVTGKIAVDTTGIERVNVLNLRNYQNAITDKNGVFKMMLKLNDVLVISAVNLETRRKIISAEDLAQEVMLVRMSFKMNQLEEVDVNQHSEINSENLRITPKGQKRYTPAERKLRTATTGLLDPLLNKMSGRTAQLKKEVAVERNEKLLIKLDGWYEDKYYTDVLKIPEDYIQGFQYYIIEDPDFARALNDKNKTLTMFYVKRLAVEYNDLIAKDEPAKTD